MKQFLLKLNKETRDPLYALLAECEAPRGHFNEVTAMCRLLTPRSILLFGPDVLWGSPVGAVVSEVGMYNTALKTFRGEDTWMAKAIESEHGSGALAFLRSKYHA